MEKKAKLENVLNGQRFRVVLDFENNGEKESLIAFAGKKSCGVYVDELTDTKQIEHRQLKKSIKRIKEYFEKSYSDFVFIKMRIELQKKEEVANVSKVSW